ncbi:MAG: hypothetical protein ACPG77_20380, partial [Nannocystaceae bacterium]
ALAPEWAAGAHAIDVTNDPHLPAGVHMRILTAQRLGLPLRPLMVYRVDLGVGASNATLHTDITWVDSNGHVLTAPFNVTPGNPVTGYLPVDGNHRCIWAEVLAEPHSENDPLRVEAYRNTVLGRVFLGQREAAPWAIGASAIHGVVVSGSGTVTGARWLDAAQVIGKAKNVWRLMSLPRENGARYKGIGNDADLAKSRVTRGAPLALGLHDQPGAPDPHATDPAGPDDEYQRVALLGEHLDTALDALLNDTSAPPQDLAVPQPLDQSGDASFRALGAVSIAALDPGVGRWLGLVEHDEAPPGAPGSVVIYLVRGFWAVDTRDLSLAEAMGMNAVSGGRVDFDNP